MKDGRNHTQVLQEVLSLHLLDVRKVPDCLNDVLRGLSLCLEDHVRSGQDRLGKDRSGQDG